ncbi:dihydroorotase [Algoriphagus namhaensis]
MATLFKNLSFLSSSSLEQPKDFLFDDGVLKEVKGEIGTVDEVIDAKGFFLSQGWTDLRCGAGDPGLEYKEDVQSLCSSLQQGGFSRAVLLPNTSPVIQSKNDIDYLLSKANRTSIELKIQAAVTRDTAGSELTEILDMHFQSGVSIFGDGLVPLSNSDRYMKILQYLQKFDGVLFDSAYDPLLSIFGIMHEGDVSTNLGLKGIPNLAEDVAIQKNLEILKYTGGKVHFQTLSTRKGVELIRKAKSEGLHVTADVSVYQLMFEDADLVDFDPNFKVLPPFRGKEDRMALLEGLLDGTIDALVSNHQPQDYDSKFMEFDLAGFGMAGLAAFVPALVKLSEELPWDVIIRKLTAGPDQIIGKSNQQSWTIFDPTEKWIYNSKTNPSKSANHPWFGEELVGKAKFVIQQGQLFPL